MRIKFWGVRGSISSPGLSGEYQDKLRKVLELSINKKLTQKNEIDNFINKLPFYLKSNFGGNTTCIEINDDEGNVFILDAGTGIRILGNDILKRDPKPRKLHLFFTHFHWDHMQGFPFFLPAYLEGFEINFYSSRKNFQNILYRQQNIQNFPRRISEMASDKKFTQLIPGKPIKIGSMLIDCFTLKHPGGDTAYSFREGNKKTVFTGDVEFLEEDIGNIKKYRDFFNDADYSIMDSQYTLEDSFYKFEWGHTSYTMAVNLAINWKVKNLILTHFDPTYTDELITDIESLARQHAIDNDNNDLNLLAAYEGLVIDV